MVTYFRSKQNSDARSKNCLNWKKKNVCIFLKYTKLGCSLRSHPRFLIWRQNLIKKLFLEWIWWGAQPFFWKCIKMCQVSDCSGLKVWFFRVMVVKLPWTLDGCKSSGPARTVHERRRWSFEDHVERSFLSALASSSCRWSFCSVALQLQDQLRKRPEQQGWLQSIEERQSDGRWS